MHRLMESNCATMLYNVLHLITLERNKLFMINSGKPERERSGGGLPKALDGLSAQQILLCALLY